MKDVITPRSITMTIESRLSNVSLLGLAIRGICESMNGVNSFEMELCVVESVNNVIKHAYNLETGHSVEVTAFFHADHLAFQVCDQGETVCLNRTSSLDVDPSRIDTLPEGGMGLFIIRSLMDETHYESTDKGNTFTMIKYFTGPQ